MTFPGDPAPDRMKLTMTNGPMPLEIMLAVMRRCWADNDEKGAVAMARAAAPYVHARAPSAGRPGAVGVDQMSDEELAAGDDDAA